MCVAREVLNCFQMWLVFKIKRSLKSTLRYLVGSISDVVGSKTNRNIKYPSGAEKQRGGIFEWNTELKKKMEKDAFSFRAWPLLDCAFTSSLFYFNALNVEILKCKMCWGQKISIWKQLCLKCLPSLASLCTSFPTQFLKIPFSKWKLSLGVKVKKLWLFPPFCLWSCSVVALCCPSVVLSDHFPHSPHYWATTAEEIVKDMLL